MTCLPEHWSTAKDAGGFTFYYNEVTREATWDAPKLADSDLKKLEQNLKRKLEKYVAELLLSYRNVSAQKGRITNDEDYR